jgi:hypothetical protein
MAGRESQSFQETISVVAPSSMGVSCYPFGREFRLGQQWRSRVSEVCFQPRIEGITHQPPTPISRSTWILETLMPQIRKINDIRNVSSILYNLEFFF